MSNALEKFTPKDIIRTETALSRFPIHRLSKKGNINIAIKVTKPTGEIKTRWKVSYNSEYGQPSPLAYKIDTLIINRRLEEEGKPTPKLIRLGSLNEICRELGINDGQGVKQTKNALLQNVGALIAAKFSYKTTSGEERTVEIADTRYGIIFTGEKLPSGDKADAVHIVLHDIYREILNNAQNRPSITITCANSHPARNASTSYSAIKSMPRSRTGQPPRCFIPSFALTPRRPVTMIGNTSKNRCTSCTARILRPNTSRASALRN